MLTLVCLKISTLRLHSCDTPAVLIPMLILKFEGAEIGKTGVDHYY
jgi:hypothetical protein